MFHFDAENSFHVEARFSVPVCSALLHAVIACRKGMKFGKYAENIHIYQSHACAVSARLMFGGSLLS